jgi:hypothetical protein
MATAVLATLRAASSWRSRRLFDRVGDVIAEPKRHSPADGCDPAIQA